MKVISNLDKNGLGEMVWKETDCSDLKKEMDQHE